MNLPPVVQVILRERLYDAQSLSDLDTRLNRGLGKELERQAAWTASHFKYPSNLGADVFATTPLASLNPLSTFPRCTHDVCAAERIDTFARMVALYSDHTVVADPFTHVFSADHFHQPEHVFHLVKALKVLAPFLNAEILQFGALLGGHGTDLPSTTMIDIANAAKDAIETNPESLRARTSVEHGYQFVWVSGFPITHLGHVRMGQPVFRLDTTEGLDELTAEYRPAGHLPVVRNAAAHEIARVMCLLSEELLFAGSVHTTSTGAGKADIEILLKLAAPRRSAIEDLSTFDTLMLPWVSDLTPTELIVLRDRAGQALPALRKLIATRLTGDSSDQSELAAELRAQVAEVAAELTAIEKQHEGVYRASLEALAISFFGYAVTTNSSTIIGGALAALIASLVHAQTISRDTAAKMAKLVTNPAIVLLEAKRILARR